MFYAKKEYVVLSLCNWKYESRPGKELLKTETAKSSIWDTYEYMKTTLLLPWKLLTLP